MLGVLPFEIRPESQGERLRERATERAAESQRESERATEILSDSLLLSLTLPGSLGLSLTLSGSLSLWLYLTLSYSVRLSLALSLSLWVCSQSPCMAHNCESQGPCSARSVAPAPQNFLLVCSKYSFINQIANSGFGIWKFRLLFQTLS